MRTFELFTPQVYMVNPPVFDIEFEGIISVLSFQAINEMIHKTANSVVGSILVLPNRIAVQVVTTENYGSRNLEISNPSLS